MAQVVQDLQSCVRGWKAYFGLTESRTILRELDQWLRRRLRAVQFNHWKTGPTVYRALRRLGRTGDGGHLRGPPHPPLVALQSAPVTLVRQHSSIET